MTIRNKYIVRFIVEAVEVDKDDLIYHHDGEVCAVDGPIVETREQAEAKMRMYSGMAKEYEKTMVRVCAEDGYDSGWRGDL